MEHEHEAARRIQAAYKGYTLRRELDGQNLTPSRRWDELLNLVRLETTRSNSTSRWAKSRILLGQLTHGKPDEEGETSKILETQHWLEMIDRYHRVGTNLHYYHTYWNANESKENFFYWLDEGNGKNVSLDACPRSQLQKERVKYLSVEERKDYRADIVEGKMVWTESKLPVDTFGSDPKERLDKESLVGVSDSSSDSDEMMAIKNKNKSPNQLKKLAHLSISHLMEKLMKATSKSYRWMFVTDTMFNFYLAPKNAGLFQHSSFLGGARVTSAGLIKIKQGKIVAISPLSGHYRCTSKHFAQVLQRLKSRGVDVDKVHISKSLAVLWTLEGWNEVKRVAAKKH